MSTTRRILVLFAHPALQKSRVNRRLAAAAQKVPGVTFHDLYEAYPDFHIDVAREQKLLVSHDAVVFQHPFYWYSCPALLKEWLDLVLEYGFAYGAEGTQLQGKPVFSALTTGGPEPSYAHDGYNQFTMRELLAPFEQTARLCGMAWLPPFVVHGTLRLFDANEIERHALDYARVLSALRDGKIPNLATAALPRLNENFSALGL
jgi:glutathione-regulated potassium-efflux system ancillary protein KefG